MEKKQKAEELTLIPTSEPKEVLNIFQALNRVTLEVDAIRKDKTNAQQGFKYRGIDDAYNTLHNLYGKYGILPIPRLINATREERTTTKGTNIIYSICDYEFTFYALDGSNVSALLRGEGMDTGDKASNKSFSIAFKYALISMHLIPTEDIVDPDATTPPESKKATPEQDKKPEITVGLINGCKTISELQMLWHSMDTTEQKTWNKAVSAKKGALTNGK